MYKSLHVLELYFKSLKIDKKELIDIIIKCKLQYLLKDYIKELDSTVFENITSQIKILRKKKDLLLKEIIQLNKEFKINNLKVINFKGVSLASDLYTGNIFRKSLDIDLLIKYDDIKNIANILNHFGYKNCINNILLSYDLLMQESDSVRNGFVHFTELYRDIEDPNVLKENIFKDVETNKKVYIDLHLNIFREKKYNKKLIDEMINRGIEQIIDNNSLFIFEENDNLINLAAHFTKDYIRTDVFGALTKAHYTTLYPKLSLIFDMKLLIDKYIDTIDWNEILKRTISWDISTYVFFSFFILNHFFPNTIPDRVISNLHKNSENEETENFISSFVKFIIQYDPKEFLFIDVSTLLRQYLIKMKYSGPKITLRTEDTATLSLDAPIISPANLLKSTYLSNYKEGENSVTVSCDQNFLKLNFLFSNKITVKQIFNSNFPCIILYLSNLQKNKIYGCYISKMDFFIQEGELMFCYNNETKKYPWTYSLKNNPELIGIDISVPWHLFDFNIITDRHFIFNIECFFDYTLRDVSQYKVEFDILMSKFPKTTPIIERFTNLQLLEI